MIRIVRVDQQTGEVFLPHRYRDGRFRVADPKLSNKKHHAQNQIPVETEVELIGLIRNGFHCRMRGERSGEVNLVRPGEISIDGADTPSLTTTSSPPSESANAKVQVIASYCGATSPTEPDEKEGDPLLPAHGRISCGYCFPGGKAEWGRSSAESAGWRLDNNPMAWGSRNPKILVLGFSKGPRQSDDLVTRRHEDIAFAGGRKNLQMILAALGIMPKGITVDQLIANPNGDYAFGSLIRCSVSKFDDNRGVWLKTGKEITSSCLRDPASAIVAQQCAKRFLSHLPPRLRLVIMLGNDIRYIEGCRSTIMNVRAGTREFNSVAYRDSQVMFVHAVHFAAQGAIVPDWCTGIPGRARSPESDQPGKRELALQAVRAAGFT